MHFQSPTPREDPGARAALGLAAAQWARVRRLLEHALQLPEEERTKLLDDLERDPETGPSVVAEVRSLLLHSPGVQTTTAAAFLASAAVPPAPPEPGREGQQLGAWRVVQALGSGGMGQVWLAERADGSYSGLAAVKVLKRSMDSTTVLARFAQEQQALARLQHPHIAHLIDAGRTADGLPYFVMELVQGRPIDEACQGLPIEARLQLFLQLADAVSHAHRNLLVHRDLKPSNVLVTAEGQVKLLDFGIAKALEPTARPAAALAVHPAVHPAAKSVGHPPGLRQPATLDGAGATADLTVASLRPFTPHYASPEQVRGEPISTATDIYSLGVLLYVLLTGQRPYARQATTAHDVAHAVLHEAPTRPSSLVPAGAPLGHRADARKQLQGDLDAIVLKALAKPVAERYVSVDALTADLRAHLRGFTVSAQPPTLMYQTRKFVARNRLAVAVTVLGTLGVTGALATALWQKQQALQQQQLARQAQTLAEARFAQVRRLARSLVFSHHDQLVPIAGTIAVREALLQDAVGYLDSLTADAPPGAPPALEPALAREVAETYFRIATIQGEQFSPSRERLADAHRHLGRALALLPRYINEPAVELNALNSAADMWLARASQESRAARIASSLQALKEAQALTQRALQRQPDALQTISRQATTWARMALVTGGSSTSANLGRVDEALVLLQQAVLLFEGLVQQEPDNAEWVHQLAWSCQLNTHTLLLAGRVAEAEIWGRRALALRDEAARRQPQNAHFRHQTATVRLSMALVQSTAGNHAAGLALQDEALHIVRATIAVDTANKAAQRDLAFTDYTRGRALVVAGQHAQAVPLLQALLDAWPSLQPPADNGAPPDFYMQRVHADTLLWLARAWLPQDAARALALARQAQPAMNGDDDNAARRWALAQLQGEEAAALQALGRTAEAAQAARRALHTWGGEGLAVPRSLELWHRRAQQLAQLWCGRGDGIRWVQENCGNFKWPPPAARRAVHIQPTTPFTHQ